MKLWYSVIKCAQSSILFWNTDEYKQVWCSSITKHIRWERPRTIHLCCQTFNWSCGKTTETHNQKAFNQISPQNISHIFPCNEILIRVPPGTVSNSASSRKKVAKRGSRNMICSTRACSKVNFRLFPRSWESWEKEGKIMNVFVEVSPCTCA